MQSLKLFRWTQVYVWMDYQLYNSGSVVTLSFANAKESFRLAHILTMLFLNQLTMFHQKIPNNSQSAQLHIFEDNAAVIHMINKGQSPNLRHVTKTHRVDLDWWFESVNFDMLFDKLRANKRSVGGYFDKRECAPRCNGILVDFMANQTNL